MLQQQQQGGMRKGRRRLALADFRLSFADTAVVLPHLGRVPAHHSPGGQEATVQVGPEKAGLQ